MPRSLQELVDLIAEMPGVGPRHARRIVQYLLRSDRRYREQLSERVKTIGEHVRQCGSCFRFDEINSNNMCGICDDQSRDQKTLMVVEKDVDVEGVEQAGIFQGRYFVLGSLFPLVEQRKKKLPPRIEELLGAIRKHGHYTETVLAFATTPEGDLTVEELKKKLKGRFPNLTVSQLGRGLSLGAEIEYADHETLRNAFMGRRG